MNSKKTVVYLPGLPSLSSDDIELYDATQAARSHLVRQLHTGDFKVESIGGNRPWLKDMLSHAEKSDAFIFPPMTSLPKDHPRFKSEAAQRWFEFFSLITGVHVGSREKYQEHGVSKPCIVMDSDSQWKLAIDLLQDLHAKGMFSSNVEDIVHVVHGDKCAPQNYGILNREAVQKLITVLDLGKGKTQKQVHTQYTDDHHFMPFRNDIKRHHFGIAVFGSATTKESSYINSTSKLAEMAGERGWRMVTGAGVDGCMGAADTGFEKGKKTFNLRYRDAPFKPAHVGVSTQPILRLEGPPKHLDQLIITNDIYDRMKVMIKGNKSQDPMQRASDSVRVIFVAPGGTGTVHEFATLMQLATNGDMMDNRKVVLLNPPSHLNLNEGFWDPLVRTAKTLGFDSMFEVAKTPEQAMQIADREYEKWLVRNPEHKDLPHPLIH